VRGVLVSFKNAVFGLFKDTRVCFVKSVFELIVYMTKKLYV